MAKPNKFTELEIEAEVELSEDDINAENGRPSAPDNFTELQKSIWDNIVNALHADYFTPETKDALSHYCMHTATAANLTVAINDFEACPDWLNDNWVKIYKSLIAQRRAETASASREATRLRFTPQATRSSHTKIDKDTEYTFE